MDRLQLYWRFKCSVGETRYPFQLTFNRHECTWFLEQKGDMFQSGMGEFTFENGNLICKTDHDTVLSLHNINFQTIAANDTGFGTALNHDTQMHWQFVQPDTNT